MAFRPSPNPTISLTAVMALAMACAPVRADEPSPAAMQVATRIVADLGLKQSLDAIVPVMLGEFEKGIVATRPELKEPLHQTLVSLVPELNQGEPGVLADVAHVMATKMTEAELKDVAAFYESPTGKKFVEAEPSFVRELQISGSAWRQKISDQLVTRAHDEMKKRGYDF